jgi:hypothetical protein
MVSQFSGLLGRECPGCILTGAPPPLIDQWMTRLWLALCECVTVVLCS